jgi:Acyl-CoA carboxylase epsilon subunit
VTEPLFHVKRGHPTPEELAALTAVLAARARASAAARRRHAAPPPWGDPAAAHRRPLPAPGHGAWKRATPEHATARGWGGGGQAGEGQAGEGLWTAAGTPLAARLRSPSGGPGDA